MRRRLLPLIALLLAATGLLRAEVYLRWNQAGYAAAQPKVLVALSTTDLAGQAWTVTRGGETVARGTFGARVTGAGDHTPFAFNHAADFSELRATGDYVFASPGLPEARFTVAPSPYERFLPLPLRHLRVMRSGSPDTLLRKFSHAGDARAPLFVPDGDPANGKWKPAVPARTVDVSGGWYDAGDQIKFTLNQAATSYHLLLAYRLKPALFGRVHSRSDLPDVLDEAKHGLEFLMRVHPDPDTFIIQVADADDHNQGMRLPEHDELDGRRPALAALSRVHMGAAAAALALGARTFRDLGRVEDATRYGTMAQTIYTRARAADTLATAFERDEVNDFYHDPDPTDQMALAALELHALTGDDTWRAQARAYAPPAATEVGWKDWNWLANAGLAPDDSAAKSRLLDETAGYVAHARERGAPWGIPSKYVWGSLARWVGIANASRETARRYGPSSERDALFWGVTDYVFGRNNWGVSFLLAEELPNTLRHLYSPVYKLLREFPTGALSEGPGERALHDSLSKWFQIPADDPFHRFNTPAGVFFDNDTDFMCQEATITAQADIVLLLTLASLPETAP
ncbi:Cellulase 1 precursor [Lacunisphaera limnophila]|uniref:Cellulase 1 n=1 Tax=Lacunisphaera limnophila TaxID=1838286 RepID=A0A1D8AV10_9BACT|nr:glycoside hydrolase family 9 protein [Lacunisphaera limnophila]AOS44729.1 Cellulase 1 precursor [Lacunisphaera limnophila]